MGNKNKLSLLNNRPAFSRDEVKRVRSNQSLSDRKRIPLGALVPSIFQPRKDVSKSRIEKLAQSIDTLGQISDIVVRPLSSGSDEEHYEILCGERRWHALKLLRQDDAACRILNLDNLAAATIAMQDNMEREDLNSMEDAFAMIEVKKQFNLTDSQIAKQLNVSRAKKLVDRQL